MELRVESIECEFMFEGRIGKIIGGPNGRILGPI